MWDRCLDANAIVVAEDGSGVLLVPGQPRYRLILRRSADGKVTGFAERREAWDLDWTRLP